MYIARVVAKVERWCGKGEKLEKAKENIGDRIEKYRNMPLKKKLIFIGTGIGATFAAGGLGATGVAGGVVWGMRGLGFASMYKGFRKEKEVVERYEERQNAIANKASLDVRQGTEGQNESITLEERAKEMAKLLVKILDKEIDNTHK